MPKTVTVLLVGNYRPTLSVVRSLGRAGHRVIVGCARIGAFAERSRYAAGRWDHPDLDRPGAFNAALLDLLRQREDIEAVFPVSGLAIMRLCEVFDRLPAWVRVAMPEPRLVAMCDHKTKLLDVARDLGIPYPRFTQSTDQAGLLAAAGQIGFPLVVKPALAERRLFGEKAVICRDMAALRATFDPWPNPGALLVQQFARGERHNLHFLAKDGRVLRCLDSVSLRTQRPNGSGLTVESVTVPTPERLRAWCEEMLAHLGYTGMGCLQFLVDPEDGRAAFLEINPRLAAGYAIVQHSGLDLPRLGLDLALGTPIPPEDPSAYAIGRRYAWTEGDLIGLKTALRQGDVTRPQAAAWLSRALRACLTAHAHAGWDWRDPRPSLAILGRGLGLARNPGKAAGA